MLVVDAVVLHLVLVPAEADAQGEAAAGDAVERRNRLRGDYRIALSNEQDCGTHTQVRCGKRSRREGDEWVVTALVLVGQLAAVRVRRSSAGRDVGVLGHPHRVEAAIPQGHRQLDRIDRDVGGEDRHSVAHGLQPPGSNGPLPICSRTGTTGGLVSERRCQLAPSTTRVWPVMKRA